MIGQRARILPKVFYIGKGSTIGTYALVAHSVGDYAIVAVNPARTIRYNIELAERLEESYKQNYFESIDEASIPYELLLQKAPNTKTVFIIGAKAPNTIISAARLFKRVIAVDSCDGLIVSLLKRLAEEKLNNVCLQSNTMSIIHELTYRRPFVLLWLSSVKSLQAYEIKVLKTIEKYSNATLVYNGGKPTSFLLNSPSMQADYQLKNDDYTLFSRTSVLL